MNVLSTASGHLAVSPLFHRQYSLDREIVFSRIKACREAELAFDVLSNGKVRTLITQNICPYCGKRTAVNLGDAVVMNLATRAMEEGELVCYHCKNPDCEHMNYYVRKADLKNCMQ
ncbi:MAG: hypothetical protein OEV79_10080 [candidate division WOR-3 bacterium]|nr:hypothetical protein [candidate division WOR-3 bacterium]